MTAVSFIGGGNRSTLRKLSTCHKSLTTCIIYCSKEYISPSAGIELKTLVVIGSDGKGSCLSNKHTTMSTTAQLKLRQMALHL